MGTCVISLVIAVFGLGGTAWAAEGEQAQAAGRCTIEKTDRRFRHLPGATLELRDAKGAVLCTFETGTEAIDISSQVTAGESYSVREASAPAGYAFAEDARFHVVKGADGTKGIVVDKGISSKAGGGLVMIDLPLSPILVSKRDADGKELPGATMTLTDTTSGLMADTWVSTEEPHAISRSKLTAGHGYRLTEDKAPEGYQMVVAGTFELARDGSVERVAGEDVAFDSPSRTFVVTDALIPVPGTDPVPTPEPDPEPTPEQETGTCEVRIDKSRCGGAKANANAQVIVVTNVRDAGESDDSEATPEPKVPACEEPVTNEEPQKEEAPKSEAPTTETPAAGTDVPPAATNTVDAEKTVSAATNTPSATTPAAYTDTTDLDVAKGPAVDELPQTGEESLACLIPVVGAATALIGVGLHRRFIR